MIVSGGLSAVSPACAEAVSVGVSAVSVSVSVADRVSVGGDGAVAADVCDYAYWEREADEYFRSAAAAHRNSKSPQSLIAAAAAADGALSLAGGGRPALPPRNGLAPGNYKVQTRPQLAAVRYVFFFTCVVWVHFFI